MVSDGTERIVNRLTLDLVSTPVKLAVSRETVEERECMLTYI